MGLKLTSIGELKMAVANFHWERDGNESTLYLQDGETPSGEPLLAFVTVVRFGDDGAFQVDQIKVGSVFLELHAPDLEGKDRDGVEAEILTQLREAQSAALTAGMTRRKRGVLVRIEGGLLIR
jgi:hypothetical protein